MAERNHYEVLKVPKSASGTEIEARYHELLHEVHPDRNPGEEERAMERTIEVLNAYRTLTDAKARRAYDFKVAHPFKTQGEVAGLKLLKGKEKKEAEARFAEGVRFWQREEAAKAVECFKAALKLEPAFGAASYDLAWAGAVLGNHHFALEVLDKACKLDPKDADLARLKKGVVAAFMGV